MRDLSKYLSARTPSLVVFCLELDPRLHHPELPAPLLERLPQIYQTPSFSLAWATEMWRKRPTKNVQFNVQAKRRWIVKGQNHKNQTELLSLQLRCYVAFTKLSLKDKKHCKLYTLSIKFYYLDPIYNWAVLWQHIFIYFV